MICLVEDFMAHTREECFRDMMVADVAHEVGGMVEGTVGDAAGVGGTGKEADGHVGVLHLPAFRGITVEHQSEEVLIAVDREVEHT